MPDRVCIWRVAIEFPDHVFRYCPWTEGYAADGLRSTGKRGVKSYSRSLPTNSFSRNIKTTEYTHIFVSTNWNYTCKDYG